MNILLEGLFLLFGVPVIIFVVAGCWVTVIIALMKLVNRLGKWFEGRKADTKIDAVKPKPTKKEQKTLVDIKIDTTNQKVSIGTTTSGKEQEIAKELRHFNCPICKLPVQPTDLVGRNECPYCGIDLDIFVILKFEEIDKEIASIKKWLKGRNIPTETKDELRRRLNRI